MPASALRHSDPQHQTLRAERDRHQKHYKALAAERDHYRQSLSEERSKSNALQAKIIALENENNGLKCKINDLQYELESLSLQPAASRPTSPAPSASASKTGPLAKGKEKAAIAETQDGDLSEL
ncbi:hypothetical protein VKT23_014947 [Stygiomarasmius scandens]|uniref:BZIP domain-containing protein n=1 Tax=Marasmiellus scandens TaxID=2682957 RepID=A0ABR1J189_9AGAR